MVVLSILSIENSHSPGADRIQFVKQKMKIVRGNKYSCDKRGVPQGGQRRECGGGCAKVPGLHGHGPGTGKDDASAGPETGNPAGVPGTGKRRITRTEKVPDRQKYRFNRAVIMLPDSPDPRVISRT